MMNDYDCFCRSPAAAVDDVRMRMINDDDDVDDDASQVRSQDFASVGAPIFMLGLPSPPLPMKSRTPGRKVF